MSMTTGGGPGGRTTLSDINVTPLVDVMLVLLIIFMVTAPMIQQGVDVNLPKTETVEIEPDENKNVIVIDKNGRILLADTEVSIEELQEKIMTNEKIKQDSEVYLKADDAVNYGKVARVLAILRKAGVKNLGMVTEPLEDVK